MSVELQPAPLVRPSFAGLRPWTKPTESAFPEIGKIPANQGNVKNEDQILTIDYAPGQSPD
jgi:hypothetical protein